MKRTVFGLILAGLMVLGASAQAAILQLDLTGSTPSVVPGNFDPVNFPAGVTTGVTPITIFDNGDTGGLKLTHNAVLNYEFIGKEAGFTNTFKLSGAALFNNNAAPGTSASALGFTGLVPFSLLTSGGGLEAFNGSPIPAGLSIAFADLGNDTFLILFNDGGAGPDFDYDDMVVKVSVSSVPLPAAVWLLLSAVLGLVSFSRVRRSGGQTA